jgi:hypothetical protein
MIIALRHENREWTPSSAMHLEILDRDIARIVGYGHCPWVLSAAPSAVVAEPS